MIDPARLRPERGRREGGSVASGGKDRDARAARERTRTYQARREFHEGQVRRRTRDNILAGVVGGVLILAVVGGQIAFYTVGPGRPAPSPSSSPSPSAPVSPSPSTSTATTPTPAP